MSNKLPKVTRRSARPSRLAVGLVAVVALLAVAIVALLSGGSLFDQTPRSDAERDYRLLLDGVKASPRDPALLMTLAETEWQMGKKSDALEHGKRAVEVAKQQPGYRLRYAGLLLLDDELASARKTVDAEIALKTPGDAEPFFLRAQVNRAEKKYDDAIADMKTGLVLSPMSADMIILYADILAEAGQKDRAIEQYQSALRFLPGDERAVTGLKNLGVKAPESTETTAHDSVPAGQ